MIVALDPRVTRPDAVRRPEAMRTPLRIDIGGGDQPYAPDEYASVDPHGTPDIDGSVLDLPFADAAVDAIWCSHVLEHLAIADVPVALRECLRVLRPRGRAIFRVPNFDHVARYWLTGADRAWAEAMVYGLQTHEGEFHRSAFSAGTIRADLEAAGFEVLRVEMRWTHSQETLQAVARKPAVLTTERGDV
jgi:ubiquinone/menaquinone biosynthesis C-methylase UbiE